MKKTLEGLFNRLIIDVNGTGIVVKQPHSNVSGIGESFSVKLPEEHVLVYKHPGRDI